MTEPQPSRRDFVRAGAALFGGGWLWLNLPAVAALSACARDAARSGDAFVNLSAAHGSALRAFAARIIPSDDGTPGAEEAGAAWFVDRGIDGLLTELREPLGALLDELDARAQTGEGAPFARLAVARQDAILRELEETEPFFIGRMLVVMGTFCDPSLGGNRDHVGFALLKLEHAPAYRPPFGWYDAQHAGGQGGGA
jgi:gluconate 2-dehydrogenase gamma chain